MRGPDRYPPAPPSQRRLPAPTRPTAYRGRRGPLDAASAWLAPRPMWHRNTSPTSTTSRYEGQHRGRTRGTSSRPRPL